MIVTLQEARDHLRSDTDADDADLTIKIKAASAAVLTYLKVADESSIPAGAAEVAKQATLLLVGEFYARREGEQMGAPGVEFGYGYLPVPVMALLYPHRDPSLA